MKSSYEVRATKFLHLIAPFLEDCYFVSDYQMAVGEFNKLYNRHVQVNNGISRVVLITSDYVIKIDYNVNSAFGNCMDEYDKYNRAVKDGYGYLFAKITPVVINSRTYWIMPRVRCIGHRYNQFNDVYEYLNDEECSYLWDNDFCDLHFENYGWKNGHPVIVDYACG